MTAGVLAALACTLASSWSTVDTSSPNGLFDIRMVSLDTAFAVGREGRILRSVDGGMSWGAVGDGLTDQELRRVRFLGPMAGMVLGQNVLARTEDGGRTWIRIDLDTGFYQAFLEVDHGGRYFAQSSVGGLRFTDDLGRTWKTSVVQEPVRAGNWTAMDFPTADTGFAATTAGIMRTIDRGASWSLLLPASDSAHPKGVVLTAMRFWSPTEGIVGGTYYPNISKTVDGGRTFARKETYVSVESFAFPTPDTGFAAGLNGTIWWSTDRGENWRKAFQQEGSSLLVRAVDFHDPERGVAVLSDGRILAYRPDSPVGLASPLDPGVGTASPSEWTRPTWSGFDGLGRRFPAVPVSPGSRR